MVAVSELVSGLDAELVRLGYKASTMVWYRGCWRRLERFFASRGVRGVLAGSGDGMGRPGLRRLLRQGAGRHAQTDRCVLVPRRADARRLRGPRGGAAPLLPHRGQADRRRGRRVWPGSRRGCGPADCAASTVRAYGTVAGEFLAFTGTTRRAGPAGRRGHRRVRRHPGRLPGQDGGAQTVRGAVVPAVRRRRRPGRRRGAGGGPGGEVEQAGQDPVGVGPGRRGQDPAGGRPRQPVRQTGLRDHLADHPARATRHRRQTAASSPISTGRATGCRWCRPRPATGCSCRCSKTSAGRSSTTSGPAVRTATARRCSSGTPPRSARSPTRTICTRSWSSTPGPRMSRSARNAATACIRSAHAGDPADGGRHTGRADRRHPRPPVGRGRPACT